MRASCHTVRLNVRIYDAATFFATALAVAKTEGMADADAFELLTTLPEDGRYEVTGGLGGDGDQFGVLDTESEEITDDRYDTEAEAEAARAELAATRIPDLNACLQMVFDPGASPAGCTIEESAAEHDYDDTDD